MYKANYLFYQKYQKLLVDENKTTLTIFLCLNQKIVYKNTIDILKDGINDNINNIVVLNLIKTVLYIYGADQIILDCSDALFQIVSKHFNIKSSDYKFIKDVYKKALKIEKYESSNTHEIMNLNKTNFTLSNKGNMIGLDIGGSDIKVSAFSDNKLVYENEILWLPKQENNINYHINMINHIIDEALSYLNNKLDIINISSAGVISNGRILYAKIYENVTEKDKIKTLYLNIIDTLKNKINSNLLYTILNDGDVSALSGHFYYKKDNILGLALGTSLASGYYNNDLINLLNEMSFIPFDFTKKNSENKAGKYLSQDGVINFASYYGYVFKEESKAKKLLELQNSFSNNDIIAKKAFYQVGKCLAYFISYLSLFIDVKNVLLLGRVMSFDSGKYVYSIAKRTIKKLGIDVNLILPNDNFIRLGQSKVVSRLIKLD